MLIIIIIKSLNLGLILVLARVDGIDMSTWT